MAVKEAKVNEQVTEVAEGEDRPTTGQILISRIPRETVDVPIIGTAPLIVHNFSAKSRQMMLDAMQGNKAPAKHKNPQAEYDDAFYRMEDGTSGFPSIAFKSATVAAARFYGNNVKMTELRGFLFVHGVISPADPQHLVKIIGEPEMREDTVRVGNSKADLRYRPMYRDWRAVLRISYATSALNLSSVLSLIDAGGSGVGVGEWRPEKKGEFGTYEVDPNAEFEVVVNK